MKHYYIIPIFIPHMGCPHTCVFCQQWRITGRKPVKPEEVDGIINSYLATINRTSHTTVEVAFYGGSFTCIPIEQQKDYLSVARRYKDQGLIDGIRLSTRPDGINENILQVLAGFNVSTIELGVQSMVDEVLVKAERGHTVSQVISAVELIKKNHFRLGLQIMPGLPGDTEETVRLSAQKVVDLKPNFVRIYPTLIIKGTKLAEMYKDGNYNAWKLERMVSVCADIYVDFRQAGIEIIRIGLQPTDELLSGEIIDGPFHPSFRHLVESELARRSIVNGIGMSTYDNNEASTYVLSIVINQKELSVVQGLNKSNLEFLQRNFPQVRIEISLDSRLQRGEILFPKIRKVFLFHKNILIDVTK